MACYYIIDDRRAMDHRSYCRVLMGHYGKEDAIAVISAVQCYARTIGSDGLSADGLVDVLCECFGFKEFAKDVLFRFLDDVLRLYDYDIYRINGDMIGNVSVYGIDLSSEVFMEVNDPKALVARWISDGAKHVIKEYVPDTFLRKSDGF